MKYNLLVLALTVAAILPATAQTQSAQRVQVQQPQASDRWCRFEGLDHGSIQVCAAYTYEQCMASRNPSDTVCFLNPRYAERPRR